MRPGHASLDKIDDGTGVVARSATRSRSGLSPSIEVGAMVLSDHDPARARSVRHSSMMNRVDLGAQSSTRTADGVNPGPLFTHAACW